MVSGSSQAGADELETVTLEELIGAMLLELGATLEELGATLEELAGAVELLCALLASLEIAALDELSAVWLELEPPGVATHADNITDALSNMAERQCWIAIRWMEESIMATLLNYEVPSGHGIATHCVQVLCEAKSLPCDHCPKA